MKISSTSFHHPLNFQRRKIVLPWGAQRFLAAFEGFEGGFAIGASVVVALSYAHLERHVLLTTAILSIIVNGFNSASVKYSSEHYMDELDGKEKKSAFRYYFIPALIEFLSYFAISFISIIPLITIGETPTAVGFSVGLTLVLLLGAGYWRGFMLRISPWRDALETMLLGAGIIAIGAISGTVLHSL